MSITERKIGFVDTGLDARTLQFQQYNKWNITTPYRHNYPISEVVLGL